jgi:hypothetical protein
MTNRVGQIYDGAVSNLRRLAISHCCLGLIAAFAYWVRPGTVSIPLRYSGGHYGDITAILVTSVAWIPYVISAVVSRKLLATRSPRAGVTFIVAASLITAASVILYLKADGLRKPPSPASIAIAVTIGLVVAAYIISAIGPQQPTE